MPWKDKIPDANDKKKAHLNYYQWVPFILLTQAFLFYSPAFVWQSFGTKTGFDINTLVKLINNSENLNPEMREKTLRYLAKHMDKALEIQRDNNSKTFSKFSRLFNRIFCFLFFQKRHGNYLLSVYLFTKVLFILNVFVQFFLLNNFLGNNYKLYGIEVIVNLWKSSLLTSSFSTNSNQIMTQSEIIESPRFPRVTMCQFQVRFLGDNIHEYVVQCALPINLFNEKIFIFIWFWLVYVAFASIYGLILWLWYLLPWNRVNFLKKYLKTMDRKSKEKFDKKMFRTFDRYYLKQDGVLVLRLIGKNSNQVFMGELMLALWDNFKRNQDYAGVFV